MQPSRAIKIFINQHGFFLLSVLLVVLVCYWRWQNGVIEQDGYLYFSQSLLNQSLSSLPVSETRLSPGLPIVLAAIDYLVGSITVSGYLVTISSFIISYIFLYQLTTSKWSFLPLVFPPIVLDQMTQISSESLFVTGLLGSIWLSQRQKPNWLLIGMLSGSLTWIRLTGVILLPWLIYASWSNKNPANVTAAVTGWLVTILALLGFNRWQFGPSGWLQQITIQQISGRATFSLWQLGEDLFRAWDWGWYRILISGVIYLVFFAGVTSWLWFKQFKTASASRLAIGIWLILISLFIFVFSVGPTPFLEEFSRFLMPIVPLWWLIGLPFWQIPNKSMQIISMVLILVSVFVVVI